MPQPQDVYAGAADGEAYELDLVNDPESDDGDFDFSTVTAATFRVRQPSGKLVTWTAAISNQTADGLRLRHPYAADGTDLPIGGPYAIRAVLESPSGHMRSRPRLLRVRDEFDTAG